MNEDLIRKAAAMPARQLHLLGAGVLLIAAAALWFYGLRAPLAAVRVVLAEQARLTAAGGDPRLLSAQLVALTSDSEALTKRLGASQAKPAAQQLVDLIGEAGTLAKQHGVALHGALPAPEEQTLAFRQSGVDVDASGSYGALLAWMAAIERARPNLGIAGFEMRASKTPGQVDMKLRIAAYRPQEGKR